jgi:hypothetical protein
MATTQVKQREYLLTVDEFSNPQVVEGKSAVALLLSRLILLEPGSDPLHPGMGVGIRRYRFNSNKDNLQTLQKAIEKQVNTYLPSFQGSEVQLIMNDDKTMNINITVGDTTYVYSSEVEDPIDTLAELKLN